MSFQGTAPLNSPSELTYFAGMANSFFSYTVGSGELIETNTTGLYQSLFSVNASGPETDNVYVKMDGGNTSGNVTRLMVGFVQDATHYLVASPGGSGGFLFEVQFVTQNGATQNVNNVPISPHVPYNTASAFLPIYLAISGTVATAYAIDQSTGLLANLASFDVSAIVSAATLQTWSAGVYFDGVSGGPGSATVQNLHWGPVAELSPVTVPNVVGDTQSVATAAIIAAGLTLGTVTPQDSALPVGQVLAQSPVGGTPANFSDPVNITVSAGTSQFVYGKFVPALNYKALMVANPGAINPRVYPPQEDVTVRVKT